MNKDLIIGYDAKRAVANGTGLGSYSRTLINDLARYCVSMPPTKAATTSAHRSTTAIMSASATPTPHSSLLTPHSSNYSDRPIDIDILLYDDLTVDEPDLKIPHPLMHERDFVMKPLGEIISD